MYFFFLFFFLLQNQILQDLSEAFINAGFQTPRPKRILIKGILKSMNSASFHDADYLK